MFACKQVARALAEQDYEKLSPFRKWALKFHVKICIVCGKFHRQVMDFQDTTRAFLAKEDHLSKRQEACIGRRKKAVAWRYP